jgi:hypothetical protein
MMFIYISSRADTGGSDGKAMSLRCDAPSISFRPSSVVGPAYFSLDGDAHVEHSSGARTGTPRGVNRSATINLSIDDLNRILELAATQGILKVSARLEVNANDQGVGEG